MKTKRDYLLKAADYIEQHPEEYYWGNVITCQCGVLAKVVIEQDLGVLNRFCYSGSVSWGELLKDRIDVPVCTSTGLSITQIIEALYSAGFTKQELIDLEDLNSKEVLSVLSKGTTPCEAKDAVLYLRTWAALLDD